MKEVCHWWYIWGNIACFFCIPVLAYFLTAMMHIAFLCQGLFCNAILLYHLLQEARRPWIEIAEILTQRKSFLF